MLNISVSKALNDAWKTTANNALALVGIFIAYMAFSFILNMFLSAGSFMASFVPYFINNNVIAASTTIGMQMLSSFVQLIFSTAFSVVFISAVLDCTKGKDIEIRFPVNKFLVLLGISTIIYALWFLVIIRLGIGASAGAFFTHRNLDLSNNLFNKSTILFLILGSIVLGIVSLYLSIRFQFTTYLFLDKNISIWQALTESWNVTRGRVGVLLLLFLALGGIALVGIMSCCIGLLYAIPLVYVTQGHMYLQITAYKNPLEEQQQFEFEIYEKDNL